MTSGDQANGTIVELTVTAITGGTRIELLTVHSAIALSTAARRASDKVPGSSTTIDTSAIRGGGSVLIAYEQVTLGNRSGTTSLRRARRA